MTMIFPRAESTWVMTVPCKDSQGNDVQFTMTGGVPIPNGAPSTSGSVLPLSRLFLPSGSPSTPSEPPITSAPILDISQGTFVLSLSL